MDLSNLEFLKQQDEAPQWMDEPGFQTLRRGYLLENETPRGMYSRVAKAAAAQYKDSKNGKLSFLTLCGQTGCVGHRQFFQTLGQVEGFLFHVIVFIQVTALMVFSQKRMSWPC